MFTGIITEAGTVSSLKRRQSGALLVITAQNISKDAVPGDSISVNGVCLTVTSRNSDKLTFDLSEETLRSTNLGQLRQGDRINLEPSLRPDGKLGGHFVTGHVDATGTIRSRTVLGDTVTITIGAPRKIIDLLVEKGSIAVDGISLTVVAVLTDSFSIVIIPHTAKVTTIGFKKAGDTVNLEADIIGKYVARFLAAGKNSIPGSDERLINSLKEAGYIQEER